MCGLGQSRLEMRLQSDADVALKMGKHEKSCADTGRMCKLHIFKDTAQNIPRYMLAYHQRAMKFKKYCYIMIL